MYHLFIWQDCDISCVVWIPTQTRFLLVLLSVTHLIMIKCIAWCESKPVVLLERLKTDFCRSKFDFHQKLQNTIEILSKLNVFLIVTRVIIFLNIEYMCRSRSVDHETVVKMIELPLIITLDHSKCSGRSWSELP